MSRRRVPVAPASSIPEGRVTLKFLADHLGLSPASISLVVNRAPAASAIPHATQQRILDAVRQFNYRPHAVARSLSRRRSLTIGVMVPEVSEGYAALVLAGLEDYLLQAGYLYFVASHRHRPDLIAEYPELLLDRNVEGIVAIDTPIARALPVPVASVSGHVLVAGVTNIVVDHAEAARLALGHLRSLGHRRIAVIKGQAFSSDTEIRWRSIRDAARTLGIPIDPKLVVQLEGEDSSPELGLNATRDLLARKRPFTAVFAFNDISAIGAIKAVRDAGRRVPDDISLVGFDDILSAAYQQPGLTTVRQPLRRMGALAAELVLKRITAARAADVPKLVSVAPDLIVRGTTAAAPGRGRR